MTVTGHRWSPIRQRGSVCSLIGQTVLVGITYVDQDGGVVDQDQFAGIVQTVEPLVAIDRGADEAFTLPPDLAASIGLSLAITGYGRPVRPSSTTTT